jgi:hypothetical protein
MRLLHWTPSAVLLTCGWALACSSSQTAASGDGGVPKDSGGSSHDANASDGSQPADSHSDSPGGNEASTDGAPTVQPGLSKVATGEYETFYLKDGVIYGYGGGSGLLGQGTYQGLCIPPRAIDTPAGLKFIDVQGGLHQSMAADVNGHVWTWGMVTDGLQGSGSDAGVGDGSVPYMITQDASGNPFDHVIAVEPVTSFDAALKDDGTVWVWGNCSGGVTGDGTASGVVYQPTKVPIPLPTGVKITKIVASSQVYALASDGTVWAWGPAENPGFIGTGTSGATDSYTPAKVIDLPTDIIDIAVGYASFSGSSSKVGVADHAA